MFLMMIIRPQMFARKHIPCSHTDTLWRQESCPGTSSLEEEPVGGKGSDANQEVSDSAGGCVGTRVGTQVGLGSVY